MARYFVCSLLSMSCCSPALSDLYSGSASVPLPLLDWVAEFGHGAPSELGEVALERCFIM